ncbi:hypothetical protein KCA24_35005, partial [Escherichia coli]|nr:hypothetical protein [Escherichia coli]
RIGAGPVPFVYSAIPGEFSGIKGDFGCLAGLNGAKSVGFVFPAAMTACAGLIPYMTMLRSETSKVVDEIRKIPEAMTAAKRAHIAEDKARLWQQITQKEQRLKTCAKGVHGPGRAGTHERINR